MHLLLIEDDRQFIQLVEQVAASLELRFSSCTRAKDGLKRLAEGDVDILVVDGLLPDKSGWWVLEELRGQSEDQRPCIVFLSAFFRDLQSFRQLESLGVSKVLHKPIAAHALRAELAALVGARQQDAQVAQERARAQAAAGFAVELARMQRAYAEKLATISAAELAALIERARRNESEVTGALRDFCHRTAGTSGSFGLHEVSHAAGRLELRIGEHPLDALVPDLEALLARLRRSGRDENKPSGLSDRLGTILLVSQRDPFIAELLSWLSQVGLTVRSAPGGAPALAGILRWWPDLIIVDDDAAALEHLAAHRIDVPILAIGDIPDPDPHGVVRLPGPLGRDALLGALARPTLRPFADASLLLCDPDPTSAASVESWLAPLGITTHAVSDVAGYMTALAETQPSVVLLDVSLSMVSGFDLCRMTKSDPATCDLPILFASERAKQADRRTAYVVGAAGFLAKPMAREELQTEVAKVLRQHRFYRLAESLVGDGLGAGKPGLEA